MDVRVIKNSLDLETPSVTGQVIGFQSRWWALSRRDEIKWMLACVLLDFAEGPVGADTLGSVGQAWWGLQPPRK